MDGLSHEELRAITAVLRRKAHAEEIEVLANRRRGLKFRPNTCVVCNTRTFLGPLCFEHMEAGRPMWRFWLDYVDPDRRNVRKIEEFLQGEYIGRHPMEIYARPWPESVIKKAEAKLDLE